MGKTWGARPGRRAGQFDEATEAYGQALAARPDFTTAHVSLGKAVGRWRSYRDHLGPLSDALGALAD